MERSRYGGVAVTRRGSGHDRWAALYAEHSAPVAAFAYLLVGEDSAAQDLLHEGFIRAFARLAHLRSPEAFRAYLKRTIVNLARDRHRKARREKEATARAAGRPDTTPGTPQSAVDMRVLLDDLSPRQRAALVLRFYEDLTYEDVGRTLGCSAGAAKKLTRRALTRLKIAVEEEDDE